MCNAEMADPKRIHVGCKNSGVVAHLPETFWMVADDLSLLLYQTNDIAKAELGFYAFPPRFSSA